MFSSQLHASPGVAAFRKADNTLLSTRESQNAPRHVLRVKRGPPSRQKKPLPPAAFDQSESLGSQLAGDRRGSSVASKNVVVAVDSSEDAVTTFQWALTNLYRQGDSLHILHVVADPYNSPASGSIYYPEPHDPELERALWRQAEQFIEEEFVKLAQENGIGVNVVLVKESKHKHVGWAVCKKAEELEASPLVLATHHKGFLQQMLLGSVSKFCAANCMRPVLLISPEHSKLDNQH